MPDAKNVIPLARRQSAVRPHGIIVLHSSKNFDICFPVAPEQNADIAEARVDLEADAA